MKLYATTTSRTTSKGIGDDTCLEIELKHGNKRIARLSYSLYNDKPVLTLDGIGREVQNISLETCKACGESMYGTVRVHHHTENGQDVT